MSEKFLGEQNIGPEKEPNQQLLRKLARELGFRESPELQTIEEQAVAASKNINSEEEQARFNELIAQIQIIGEPLTEHEEPRTGLAQIGLMLVRAATLFESNRLEDCQDEIYDILTALDNIVNDHPEVESSLQQIEELYGEIKRTIESQTQNESGIENDRAQKAEQNMAELARRREKGELDPNDYEVNYLAYLQRTGSPLARKEVGNHAIVIKPEEFEGLGYLEVILASGERITLDFTDENFDKTVPLVIFPEELGEEEIKEE